MVHEVKAKKLSVEELARQELAEEVTKGAVGKLKEKLKELKGARQIVKNLEREVDDLKEELEEELSALE